MHPKLLLLTLNFPYPPGEEFLETEVVYLSAYFDIIIAPINSHTEKAPRRSVPDDVVVWSNIISKSASGTAAWLLRHPQKAFSIFAMLFGSCGRVRCKLPLLWQLLRFTMGGQMLALTLAEKLELQQSIDVVYSYWLFSTALAATLLKKEGLAKLSVARAHRGDLYHERSDLGLLPGQALAVENLDRIFCISEHGLRYLRQQYPSKREKFELSRLGVLPAPSLNPLSQEDKLHLVSCSYLTSVKRVDLLIDALSICEFPVIWTHLGGGEDEAKLKSLAEKLPRHIEWHITGILPNQDVLLFYQENPVDLFVNVSASEGLPVSIMEALSYGIPVAATDVGGVSEIIHADKNGYLWPVDVTIDTIAATFHHFYRLDGTEKDAMRKAAWQTWHNFVNAEVQYPNFAHRILSLI